MQCLNKLKVTLKYSLAFYAKDAVRNTNKGIGKRLVLYIQCLNKLSDHVSNISPFATEQFQSFEQVRNLYPHYL